MEWSGCQDGAALAISPGFFVASQAPGKLNCSAYVRVSVIFASRTTAQISCSTTESPCNAQARSQRGLHAEEARPRNHRLTAHEVAWVEEEDEEDALPASRSSLGKQQAKRSGGTGKGRGGSATKGPSTARGRKMKRISGGSSDEADDGSEGGHEEEEMEEEEEEKVPVPRSRRSRGRGLPVSKLGEGVDGAGSDQDVSLSSSDGGGSGDDADGDDNMEEDDKRTSKPSVKKVCQIAFGQLHHALSCSLI